MADPSIVLDLADLRSWLADRDNVVEACGKLQIVAYAKDLDTFEALAASFGEGNEQHTTESFVGLKRSFGSDIEIRLVIPRSQVEPAVFPPLDGRYVSIVASAIR